MNARSLLVSAGVLGAVLAGCSNDPAPATATAPEIVQFKASRTEAAPNETITLSWSVKDAETISVEQLGVGPLVAEASAEGTHDVTLGESDAVFVLYARNALGFDSLAIRVKVGAHNPLVVLAAFPEQIQAGATAALTYSAPTMDGLKLLDEAGAPVAPLSGATGTVTVSPRFDARYVLQAGDQKTEALVTVTPGIVSLEAVHVAGEPGKVEVRWSAGGADVLKLEAAGRGEIFPGSTALSRGTIAEGSFTDTLPPNLPADSQLEYTLVVGEGEAAVRKTIAVRVGATPAIDAFTAPTYARAGGHFPLEWRTRGAARIEIWQGSTQLHEVTAGANLSSGIFFADSPAEAASYELRAYDAKGNLARAEASTEPVGDVALVEFEPSASTIAEGGEAVTLRWNVINARRVRIAAAGLHVLHEVEGLAAESGTITVYPNAATVQYVLTADNTVGSSLTPVQRAVSVTTLKRIATWPEAVPDGTSTAIAEAEVAGNDVNAVAYEGFPNVVKNAPGEAFVDIREIGLPVPFGPTDDTDNEKVALPEPFTFVHYGKRRLNQSHVNVSVNGWMSVNSRSLDGSAGLDDNAVGLPSASLDKSAIAPWFADLRMTPEGRVDVALVGQGLARRLVVQWTDVALEGAPGSRLTFQAQVYQTGRMTFAYAKVEGVAGAHPIIGVQNDSQKLAVLAPSVPVSGDVFTFFGPTQTPSRYPIELVNDPYLAGLHLQDGGYLEINARPPKLAKDLFYVSEANFAPAAELTNGEWFELTSVNSAPINLRGLTLDFGPGQRHRIETDVILPPNGQLLLGQSQGAGEGLAIDHVYGPTLSMADLFGTVSIGSGQVVYSEITWAPDASRVPGTSVRKEPAGRAGWVYTSGTTGVTCPGATPYGSHGQLGTPKSQDTGCFPYLKSETAGSFESIRATGTQLELSHPRGNVNQVDLPFPVRVGFKTSSTLWVASNGFVTLDESVCVTSSSGCFYSNSSSPSTTAQPYGALAVFWDMLHFADKSPAAIFWEARNPDGIPGTGDESVLVSWENATTFNTTAGYFNDLNFQILFTAAGDVEYRYGTMTGNTVSSAANNAKGGSATTWLGEPTNQGALRVNVNSATNPGIKPDSTIRFTWAP